MRGRDIFRSTRDRCGGGVEMSLEPTGFCWKCGRQISEGLLFCPKPNKCEEQYKRQQTKGIRIGKRAGYGAAGSMH
jgi:hypothetical protein